MTKIKKSIIALFAVGLSCALIGFSACSDESTQSAVVCTGNTSTTFSILTAIRTPLKCSIALSYKVLINTKISKRNMTL